MQHPSEDDLALVALGEPVVDVSQHVASCPHCDAELKALTATVHTARRADLSLPSPPPQAVWERIADELGVDPSLEVAAPASVQDAGAGSSRRTTRRPWRGRALAGALTVVGVAAAGLLVLGLLDPPLFGDPVATPLAALDGSGASGDVLLADDRDERSLLVETAGLPRPDGFYEVWLLDVDGERLVALGALDASGQGRLTVPDGVEIAEYPVVDVSLEPDDGDPGHSGNSILRGDLPT